VQNDVSSELCLLVTIGTESEKGWWIFKEPTAAA